MALVSPGVEVTVIDESFYTPAEPGSTPLIVVASAKNKLNGSGTAVASGTLTENAGKVFRITSQRELVETFGIPFFEKTATANPIHGGERNEYGLLAAYSALGVTNSVFIMRANVDLSELAAETAEPGAEPRDGTWWINTNGSNWGIQEWNSNPASTAGGQKFTTKFPIILTDADAGKLDGDTPKDSVGNIGDYAVVFRTVSGDGSFAANYEFARIFYKTPGNSGLGLSPGDWVVVGSNDWCSSWPVAVSSGGVTALTPGNQFSINGTVITVPGDGTMSAPQILAELATAINNTFAVTEGGSVSATVERGRLRLYSNGATEQTSDSALSGAITLANVTGTPLTDIKIEAGVYLAPKIEHAPHTRRPLFRRSEQPSTKVGYPSGSVWIKTTEPNQGARLRVSKWSTRIKAWVPFEAPMLQNGHDAIFNLDRSGGGRNLEIDTLFTQWNATENYSYRTPDNSLNNFPDFNGYDYSLETAEFRIWRRRSVGQTTIISVPISNQMTTGSTRSVTIKQSYAGSRNLSAATTVTFVATGTPEDANIMAGAINAARFEDDNGDAIVNNVTASVTETDQVVISHNLGGEIRFKDGTAPLMSLLFTPYNLATGTGTVGFYDLNSGNTSLVSGSEDQFLASNWIPLAASIRPKYYAASVEPLEEPEDGQLWYNPSFGQVDMMIHNGNTWVGYRNFPGYQNTDPAGPTVSATMPETQSDGTELVDGDLWISTADLENFPIIYRYNGDQLRFLLVDTTDQTTEDGVVFSDARMSVSGLSNKAASIKDLLTNNYIDPDAPDPALYPKGIMLYNTRRSYGNVKRYAKNYINRGQDNPRYDSTNSPAGGTWTSGESMSAYAVPRWVTASPNQENGSGTFGRKAQRSIVVQRMKSVVDTSEEARDEERRNFNLIAAPGYPELLSNLINLNIDRKITSFVIGDTPLRLKSDATTLTNWGTNARLVFDNGDDGIVSYDEYCGVYYPNGFTTDLSGANAVVPASHMMLRTMILSDQVSYPWFAPAGTRRGGITNATAVGFIDAATGEFRTVALNGGQRDTLYELKVNPIPFFVGVGLVAYGQKTRARNASALDRINVARLVVYLRSQLNKLARPYVFEPNDQITRDEIKGAAESLLLELVALRAIYDFAVVCDESNNTPSRIDRNELYLDIAIEPTKAVEFIYIPLRLKNTGEI